MLSETLLSRFQLSSKVMASLVFVFSLVALVGWATANYQLTILIPSFDSAIPFSGKLHSAAAINLFLLAIASILVSQESYPKLKLAGFVLPVIVLISTLVALGENFLGLVVDYLTIYTPDESAPGITYPTPMISEVAITLFLLSLATLLTRFDSDRSITFAQIASVLSMPIPLLILFGAATQSPKLCALGGCFEMSLAFALLALGLSFSIIFIHPDLGIVKLLSSTASGGTLCRRAGLVAMLIPVLLILRTVLTSVKVNGVELIEGPLSWAMFGLIIVGIVVYMVITGAKNMEQVESERIEIEDKLIQTEQALTDSIRVNKVDSTLPAVRYKNVCRTCSQDFPNNLEVCPLDGGKLDRVVNHSLSGTTFLDKYKVDTLLGEGGMSSVYLANHEVLNRNFAIKVLKDHISEDALKRFKREAKLTSALDHENIVGVHDFGIAPDGRSFLIMEYVEGETMDDLLDRVGVLKPKVARYFLLQVCDALGYAHKQGIIHRDLKPANIMLVKDKDGGIHPKLVDFGLAKVLDEDVNKSQKLTQTGECFGSPLYMSPEQCLGESVDHRADIYALGCIAYELITGRPPFMGKTILETFNQQVNKAPEPIADKYEVPKDWAGAIYTALAKNKEHRQRNVQEFKNSFNAKVG